MRYYYSKLQKKVIPADEYHREQETIESGKTVYFSVSTDGSRFNYGLGCYQRDVKEHLKQHEQLTGEKLVEVGNQKPNREKKEFKPEVTRDDIEQIKAKANEIYG